MAETGKGSVRTYQKRPDREPFGLSPREFAEKEGLTLNRVNQLLQSRRIFGQTRVDGRWRIGPPAKVISK